MLNRYLFEDIFACNMMRFVKEIDTTLSLSKQFTSHFFSQECSHRSWDLQCHMAKRPVIISGRFDPGQYWYSGKAAQNGNSKSVRVDEAVDHSPDLNGSIRHTVSVAKVEENMFIMVSIRGLHLVHRVCYYCMRSWVLRSKCLRHLKINL